MMIQVKITRDENANYFGCNIGDIVKVEFEEYVAAVVASEFASGSTEALKAQAVASRSYAMARGVLNGTPISDASSSAQAYRAPRYSDKYQRCIDATKATAGQVLWYGSNPASTVFSASNGGRTVSSQEKWGGFRAYLPAQDDPWDAAAGGKRIGHGVGMSQRGAKYAANQGFTYRQILEFYYPNTTLMGEYGATGVKVVNEKAEKVVELAKSCLGWPYVFGAWGEECTPSNRKRRARSDHPTIISKCPVLNGTKGATCEACKWYNAKIFDCRGFTYYCLKQAGVIKLEGGGATSQYNYKGNWAQKGSIKEMPNLVCCLFQYNSSTGKMAHTGLHIGNGDIIHCSVNVQTGTTADKAWTHYAIPLGLYTETEIKNAGEVKVMKTLKKGSKGEEVKQLQTMLNALGYDCGVADGSFGANTDKAVRAFQQKEGLLIDGIVGKQTWTLLESRIRPAEEEPVIIEEPDDNENDIDNGLIIEEFENIKVLYEELGKRIEALEAKIKEGT